MYRSIFLILISAFLFEECSTDMKLCTQAVPAATLAAVPAAQLATDVAIIDAYLTSNAITALQEEELRYTITTAGVGKSPCLEGSITVTYTGRILNANGSIGATFDESTTPVTFNLNELILGWKIAFLKLNKGAVATLYVPSGYGYGTAEKTNIPANSILLFDVKLVSFQ